MIPEFSRCWFPALQDVIRKGRHILGLVYQQGSGICFTKVRPVLSKVKRQKRKLDLQSDLHLATDFSVPVALVWFVGLWMKPTSSIVKSKTGAPDEELHPDKKKAAPEASEAAKNVSDVCQGLFMEGSKLF